MSSAGINVVISFHEFCADLRPTVFCKYQISIKQSENIIINCFKLKFSSFSFRCFVKKLYHESCKSLNKSWMKELKRSFILNLNVYHVVLYCCRWTPNVTRLQSVKWGIVTTLLAIKIRLFELSWGGGVNVITCLCSFIYCVQAPPLPLSKQVVASLALHGYFLVFLFSCFACI